MVLEIQTRHKSRLKLFQMLLYLSFDVIIALWIGRHKPPEDIPCVLAASDSKWSSPFIVPGI